MINTILCAIDISDPTEDKQVLERAAKMAALEGAQLDIVTVVPDFGLSLVGSFFDQGHHDEALTKAKGLLNSICAGVLGDDVNAKARHVVATGKVYDEILKTAKASKADMIVIGAHAPELGDFLLGPNAARVVRHSRCSVYVVR